MTDTPEADDSIAYWNRTHDRPRLRDVEPGPARTGSSAPLDERPPSFPPPVRSRSENLLLARVLFDAALTLVFGILCLAMAGSSDEPVLPILMGLLVIGYSGYIALFARSYEMPYYLYALAILCSLWVLFG